MAADGSGGARPAHGVSTGLYVFTFILTGVPIPDFDAPGGFLTATVHMRVAGRLEEIVPLIRAVGARARENQAGQAQAAMTGALGVFVDGADAYLPSMVLQLRSGSKLVNQTSVSSEYVRLTADLTAPVISAELAKAPLFALLGLFGVTEAYEAAVIRVFQAIMRAAQKVGLTGVIRAVEELDIAAMNAALRKLRDEHAAATGGKGAVGAGGKPPAATGGKAGADNAAAGGGKTPPPATTTTADDAAGAGKTPPPANTGAGKGAGPVADGAAAAATDAGKAGAAAGGADAGRAGGARATEGGSVSANPYLKQLRQHLAGLLSTATVGTLVPLGIDLGAQDIQVRRGHRPGRDDGQTRTMGLVGLAGSPFGYATAVGIGRLAQGAEKAGLHGIQNHWVTHVVIEALTEAVASGAGSVTVTGEYDGSLLGDLSSGATEGVASRVGDRVAAALPDPKAALPPGGLQLPDIPPVAPPVPPAAEPETTGAGTTTPAPTQAAPASPQNEEPPTPVAVQPPPATASISDTAGILDRTGSDAGSESDAESVSGSSVATETSSVLFSRVSSASSVSSLASDGSDGGKGYSGSSPPAKTLTSPGLSGTPATAASATAPPVDTAAVTAALKQRVDLAAAERVVTKLADAVPPSRAALLDELAAKTTPPPAADPTPATTTPAGGPAPKTTWPQAWNTVLSGPAGTDAPPPDHPLIQDEKHVTISAAAGGEHAASPVQVRTVRLPDPPPPPDLPGQSAPAHPTKLDELTVRAHLIPDPQAGPKVTPAALTNLADTMRFHAATLWGTPQHAGDGTFVRVKFEPIVGRLTGPHLLDGPIPQLRIDQHALTNPTSLLQHAVGDILGLDANATTAGLPADAAARLADLATAAEAPVTPALPKDGWLPPPAIVNPTTWAPPPHPTPPAGGTGEPAPDGWPAEWNEALDHARPNAPASTIAVDSGLLPVPLDHPDPEATNPPEPHAQAWLDWIDRLSWPAGHEPAALLQVRRVPLTHPDTGKTTVVVEATLPVAVVPEPGAAVPPGALAAAAAAAKAQLDQLNQQLKTLPPALVHGHPHVVQLRWQDTKPDGQPGFVLAVPAAGAPAQPLGKLASWGSVAVAELLAQTHTPAPPPHDDLLTAAAGQLAKRAWTVPATTGGRPGPAGPRAFQARTATIAHTPRGDPHHGATVPPGHHTAVVVAALHVRLNPSTADAEPVTERELTALADRIQSQVDMEWNTLPYLHDAGSHRLRSSTGTPTGPVTPSPLRTSPQSLTTSRCTGPNRRPRPPARASPSTPTTTCCAACSSTNPCSARHHPARPPSTAAPPSRTPTPSSNASTHPERQPRLQRSPTPHLPRPPRT